MLTREMNFTCEEIMVYNVILINSMVQDPFQSFSYLGDEVPVFETNIHRSDLRSIYFVHSCVVI